MKQIDCQITISCKKDGTCYTSRRRSKKKSNVRRGWDDYGISKERYRELRAYCMDSSNADIVRKLSNKANGFIGQYIFISVTQNISYDDMEFLDGTRIPCGRTDFYGYRRLFYHLLDKKTKGENEWKRDQARL